MREENLYAGCPVQYALQFLSGKWQMGILWNLKEKALRFGELKNLLPGITEKMLAQELRYFEKQDIVQKQVYAAVPPKVEYSLKKKGQSLIPVIATIVEWGYLHLQSEKLQKDMFFTPASVMNDIDQKIEFKAS